MFSVAVWVISLMFGYHVKSCSWKIPFIGPAARKRLSCVGVALDTKQKQSIEDDETGFCVISEWDNKLYTVTVIVRSVRQSMYQSRLRQAFQCTAEIQKRRKSTSLANIKHYSKRWNPRLKPKTNWLASEPYLQRTDLFGFKWDDVVDIVEDKKRSNQQYTSDSLALLPSPHPLSCPSDNSEACSRRWSCSVDSFHAIAAVRESHSDSFTTYCIKLTSNYMSQISSVFDRFEPLVAITWSVNIGPHARINKHLARISTAR